MELNLLCYLRGLHNYFRLLKTFLPLVLIYYLNHSYFCLQDYLSLNERNVENAKFIDIAAVVSLMQMRSLCGGLKNTFKNPNKCQSFQEEK